MLFAINAQKQSKKDGNDILIFNSEVKRIVKKKEKKTTQI